ncbi:T7SS effector LXG polymorphic toxin [Halalkalibacter sp. APA_J-10(15)]|uniref:T7SS effector LXG polymorphic toxin n=1 Tax=Halalkalibacter sp. APA_J-10(15) TaxID=2933805 RepID=UPI001FF57887|nr:T7SS effector LXG polymorphic toxin [Halalkalibacter sp. APA_J-10(15)]MCK0473913.1 LXG domain-containing protein [Halalkalibacter sp. APA_J-10(15)]
MANEKVNMAEVHSFKEEQSQQLRELRQGLRDVRANIKEICRMPSFKGEAADAAKVYFGDVHGTLLRSFEGLFIQLEKSLQKHIHEFHMNVDRSERAIVESSYVKEKETEIEQAYQELERIMKQIDQTIRSVSDLTSATSPSTSRVQEDHADVLKVTSNLTRQAETFTKTGRKDQGLISQSIAEIERLMSAIGNQTSTTRAEGFQTSLSTIQPLVTEAKESTVLKALLSIQKAESGQISRPGLHTNEAKASLSSLGLQKYAQTTKRDLIKVIVERVLARMPLRSVVAHFRRSPHNDSLVQLGVIGTGNVTEWTGFQGKPNGFPLSKAHGTHEKWWLKTATHSVDQGSAILDTIKGWNIPMINSRIHRMEQNMAVVETELIQKYFYYKPLVDYFGGVAIGAGRSGIDTGKGLWEFAKDPVGTVKDQIAFAGEVIKEPGIIIEMGQMLRDSFTEDVIDGTSQSRGEWLGYATGLVLISVYGDKGLSRLGQAGKMANTAKNNRTDSSNRPTATPPAGTLGTTLGTIQSTATTVQNKLQRGMDRISDLAARLGMPPVVASSVPFNVYDTQAMVRKLDESDRAQYSRVETGGNKGIDNAKDITKLTVDDIPTAKSGDFNKFFNSLTRSELDELWKDKKIRKKIERQLREPGGLHEWHLVSRAPQFKYWNIGADEIKDLRTAISDVKFVNPNGVHGGLGSTKAHNELLAIIDTSSDYNTFVRRLNNWANYRLEGGVSSLPQDLRLK